MSAARLDAGTRQALAEAALGFAAEHPWREVSIARLAERAGRPLAEFHPAAPADAVDAVEAWLDRAVAASAPNLAEPARERLFDLCMRRFEAMEPHRAAFFSMESGDPLLRLAESAYALRSARWILGLAGLADGMLDGARVGPLALILIRARNAWRGDAAGDFARTMVSLDRDLRRAEAAENRLAPLRRQLGLAGAGVGGGQRDLQGGAEAA